MVFGLLRKLGGGGGLFIPIHMRPKGGVIVAPLETLREIERGHVFTTGVTCLCTYILYIHII